LENWLKGTHGKRYLPLQHRVGERVHTNKIWRHALTVRFGLESRLTNYWCIRGAMCATRLGENPALALGSGQWATYLQPLNQPVLVFLSHFTEPHHLQRISRRLHA
jgi:hypothetical protein